jgi:hypothetical protein
MEAVTYSRMYIRTTKKQSKQGAPAFILLTDLDLCFI